MTMFPEEALLYFRNHHGMATGSALAATGISRRQRDAAVEGGLLEPMYERVFHIATSPLTLEAHCAALSMAYPRGFVTGPSGGRLMSLRRLPTGSEVQFCVPHGTHIGPFDGVVIRQSTKIRNSHVVVRGDGIRIASGARLAFDLAVDLSALNHRSVVDQLLNDGRCSMSTLGAIGRELAHPARPGSQRFIATLMARSGRPADSHPEVVIAGGLRARGVPVVAQVEPLLLPGGRRITLDMAVPSVRWGVEIDVHPDHLLLDGTTRDKRRDRQCHRVGWQVERVTELDLVDINAICDELADLYRVRSAVAA
ncbi:MAG TPA: hypothetical protein PLP26_08505 [Ilumatobacteraceae bacterium]|nr:hypothetical protein [Ilumatobacteraceae bacterium]